MVQAVSSALTALQVLGRDMSITANNVANMNTPGFKRTSVADAGEAGTTGGTATSRTTGQGQAADKASGDEPDSNLAEDMTNLTIIQRSYEVNLKTISTDDEMKGDILNIVS